MCDPGNKITGKYTQIQIINDSCALAGIQMSMPFY